MVLRVRQVQEPAVVRWYYLNTFERRCRICESKFLRPVGSHKGTEYVPSKWVVPDGMTEGYFCQCKLSGKKPLCDGTRKYFFILNRRALTGHRCCSRADRKAAEQQKAAASGK